MQCYGPISVMKRGQDNPRVRDLVPCGRCAACLHNRRAEWVTRLEEEMRVSSSAHFVTLTYADPPEGDGGFSTLFKPDFQLFMKRLRKQISDKLKYYAVGEYGSKSLRPHYHAIMFNLPNDPLEILMKSWGLGIVHVGSVTSASIRYTLKYIMFSKKILFCMNMLNLFFPLCRKVLENLILIPERIGIRLIFNVIMSLNLVAKKLVCHVIIGIKFMMINKKKNKD